jgi:hypothetical protein
MTFVASRKAQKLPEIPRKNRFIACVSDAIAVWKDLMVTSHVTARLGQYANKMCRKASIG